MALLERHFEGAKSNDDEQYHPKPTSSVSPARIGRFVKVDPNESQYEEHPIENI
jgi:hypothetical protein